MYNAQFTRSHDDVSNEPIHKLYNVAVFRDHPSYRRSQWEMILQGNMVSDYLYWAQTHNDTLVFHPPRRFIFLDQLMCICMWGHAIIDG